jgi:hypothetical protein
MAPGQISGNAHAASAGLSDPLTEERVGSVDAARNEWIGRLVDLSRRNNLLYFRELRVGTLDLSGAPREALQALLQSGRTSDDAVPLSDFFARDDELTRPGASLKQIWARAVSNFEEKGLDTQWRWLNGRHLTKGETPLRPCCLSPSK